MSTIVTRAGKGSPLTNTEVDSNFTNLNTDKIQVTGTPTNGQALIWNGTAWVPGESATYPAAGIANSTGSAWGTSYSTSGTGTVVALATSPTLVTPALGTPTSGNFSTGTFTWPTFNQNTTGTAANVTGTVAIANGGTGQTTANAALNALIPSQAANSGKFLTTDGTNTSWATTATAVTLSNDTSTSTNLFPLFASTTSGTASTIYTGNAKLLYKPSTGDLQSTAMVSGNGITINASSVTASYTIAAGTNGFSVGPLTIDSGVTVTVTSGQRHIII
jgi:hypothetical protein